jgi:hypothetical protein
MCACARVCVYIHIYTYIHTHTYIYTYTYKNSTRRQPTNSSASREPSCRAFWWPSHFIPPITCRIGGRSTCTCVRVPLFLSTRYVCVCCENRVLDPVQRKLVETMYACIHVCMCGRSTCTCVHAPLFLSTRYVCGYLCIYVCVYGFIPPITCMCTCVRALLFLSIRYVCMYVCMRIRVYFRSITCRIGGTSTHIHTNIHTYRTTTASVSLHSFPPASKLHIHTYIHTYRTTTVSVSQPSFPQASKLHAPVPSCTFTCSSSANWIMSSCLP